MRGKKILPVVLTATLFATGVMAHPKGHDKYANSARSTFDSMELSITGNLNGSVTYDGDDSGFSLSGSTVTLEANWDDRVRAVITANLEKLQEAGKLDFVDDFEIQEFIKEAYIEIRNIGGGPVAVIVGKHAMAFSQNYQNMPVHAQSPVSDLQTIDEVVGLTLRLEEGFFGTLEASFFETEAGDLGIGDESGYSVRLTKDLTETIRGSVSYASMTNQDKSEEQRFSVGVVARVSDQVVAYAEAINSDNGTKDYWAFTVGASVELNAKDSVSVEFNTIEDELKQYGIAFSHKLNASTTLSVGLRHTVFDDPMMDDDTTLTGTINHKMGTILKERRDGAK